MSKSLVRKALALGLTVVALLTLPQTAAAVPALWFGGFDVAPSPQTVANIGWEFTANSDIAVSHLGFFDYGRDGLTIAHEVGIFNESGSLLATAMVGAGTTAALVDGFRYVAISPLTLSAGQNYVISTYSGKEDPFVGLVTGLTTDPAISYVGSTYLSGGTRVGVSSQASAGKSLFGPNFQIAAAVPEPGTLLLLGLGLAGAAGASRARRRTRR